MKALCPTPPDLKRKNLANIRSATVCPWLEESYEQGRIVDVVLLKPGSCRALSGWNQYAEAASQPGSRFQREKLTAIGFWSPFAANQVLKVFCPMNRAPCSDSNYCGRTCRMPSFVVLTSRLVLWLLLTGLRFGRLAVAQAPNCIYYDSAYCRERVEEPIGTLSCRDSGTSLLLNLALRPLVSSV